MTQSEKELIEWHLWFRRLKKEEKKIYKKLKKIKRKLEKIGIDMGGEE